MHDTDWGCSKQGAGQHANLRHTQTYRRTVGPLFSAVVAATLLCTGVGVAFLVFWPATTAKRALLRALAAVCGGGLGLSAAVAAYGLVRGFGTTLTSRTEVAIYILVLAIGFFIGFAGITWLTRRRRVPSAA